MKLLERVSAIYVGYQLEWLQNRELGNIACYFFPYGFVF